MQRALGIGRRDRWFSLLAAAVLMAAAPARASYLDFLNDGKVLLTPGVGMTDGAAGGGAVPWAVIAGYETRDGINASVHYTYANLPNYALNSAGINIGFFDRLEVSYVNDNLTTGSTFDTVGLLLDTLGVTNVIRPFNTTIREQIFGAKIRLLGEAIYDSDNLIPQVAVGAFFKENQNKPLLRLLNAKGADGVDYYVAMTKIFFPYSTLINVTLRYTNANQEGLTGFGGPNGNHHKIRPEVSVAYLLNKATAIGGEFQMHRHNQDGASVNLNGLNLTALQPVLSALGLGNLSQTLRQKESNWYDIFVAYAPSKNLSMTFAYVYLGNITITPNQAGFYTSFQASF